VVKRPDFPTISEELNKKEHGVQAFSLVFGLLGKGITNLKLS
jgi:hypothetical protein